MKLGLFLFFAYIVGSIPTGLWLGRAWEGVDVRQHGSGNLGATNVFRVLGLKAGIITLLIDMLKGFLPVVLAKTYFGSDFHATAAVGLAAICGHTMSIFVRFRGGKGVATSAGVFAGLLPIPCFIAVGVFLLILLTTGYVSAGSIGGVVSLAMAAFAFRSPLPLSALACLTAVFVLWTHRANIRRLSAGLEPKMWKAKTL